MATVSSQRLAPSTRPATFVRMLDRYFYFGMSLLILVLVTVMFSTTVPARLFHPKIAPPSIVWVHGAVFYGWVLFFILQSGLVKIRKTYWHRTIGWFGVVLGVAIAGLGVSTTIVMHRFEFLTLHQGQDAITSISIPADGANTTRGIPCSSTTASPKFCAFYSQTSGIGSRSSASTGFASTV